MLETCAQHVLEVLRQIGRHILCPLLQVDQTRVDEVPKLEGVGRQAPAQQFVLGVGFFFGADIANRGFREGVLGFGEACLEIFYCFFLVLFQVAATLIKNYQLFMTSHIC